MKLSLAIASLAVLLLSACSKEAPKPAPVAVLEGLKAEDPAAPAAAVSEEDKNRAMEPAKAAAKSVGGKSE